VRAPAARSAAADPDLSPHSLRSRGFGFVTYASEEAVEAVFASGTVYKLVREKTFGVLTLQPLTAPA